MSLGSCLAPPHEIGSGPANMARDEALLEWAVATGRAVLRAYGWREPCLSLGYFQRIGECRDDPRWSGVPVVRRPTGGGAILHHHELTYALALPTTHSLARDCPGLYRAVHEAIAIELGGSGVAPSRRGGSPLPASERPFLCFADQDPEDIVVSGRKLVGSAQRRRAGVVLQHGSILLARSPLAPELPGLDSLASRIPTGEDLAMPLLQRIAEALGLVLEPGSWPAAIRARAEDLEREVYTRESWTARR